MEGTIEICKKIEHKPMMKNISEFVSGSKSFGMQTLAGLFGSEFLELGNSGKVVLLAFYIRYPDELKKVFYSETLDGYKPEKIREKLRENLNTARTFGMENLLTYDLLCKLFGKQYVKLCPRDRVAVLAYCVNINLDDLDFARIHTNVARMLSYEIFQECHFKYDDGIKFSNEIDDFDLKLEILKITDFEKLIESKPGYFRLCDSVFLTSDYHKKDREIYREKCKEDFVKGCEGIFGEGWFEEAGSSLSSEQIQLVEKVIDEKLNSLFRKYIPQKDFGLCSNNDNSKNRNNEINNSNDGQRDGNRLWEHLWNAIDL